MDDISEQRPLAEHKPAKYTAAGWQMLWFLLHLAAIYAIVKFFTPWLAGWVRGTLLPLLQQPTSSSRFEFLYSHIFALSFVPAFFAGLVNVRFKYKAAQFVWLVPTVILAYKFATFPAPSVLQNQFALAFHQYFGGGFAIGEFRNWQEFWNIVESNSDLRRGVAQMDYTAPFYAGAAYSVAAWIGHRTELSRRVADRVEAWERSRFGHQS
jgi:undecaprenyl pyrophosphate phosphatase UppP